VVKVLLRKLLPQLIWNKDAAMIKDKFLYMLATWFGCGLMKKAPGTWGTLGAMPFGIGLLYLGGAPLLLACAILLFFVGYVAAHFYEQKTGTHDSGAIVIDEVVGVWLTLCVAHFSLISFILAFALFRFFDILKPWPIKWADDKIPGAWGVMIDDVIAGIFAAIILIGIQNVIFA
jgi:phosphatidylglycerophosphatase A